MTTIDKILEALFPYQDKVVIHPLTMEEIDLIQSNYQKQLPNYYIEFLQKIGLKQDLVWGLTNRIRDFEDLSEFISSKDYFKFGDNGGEDYWLLKFEDETNREIFEYDFYCDFEIKSMDKTFDELLWEGFEDIRKRYEKLAPNSEKDWCVEFSVGTNNTDFLQKSVREFVDIKILEVPVMVGTSLAGIKNYEGKIEIEGQEIVIKRYTNSQGLYFNVQEPIANMKNNSLIKKLNEAFSTCVFDHTMVDYGIMNREKLKEIDQENTDGK